MLQEEVGRVATVRWAVTNDDGEVSGTVINNTKQTLRQVRLQINYSWRWKNEFQPGKDDPGALRYYILSQEIPPGANTKFTYKPSPALQSRTDGQFDISVKIVSFESWSF
jgi:hypothetical protein